MKKIITIGASTSSQSINKQLAKFSGSLLNNVEVENVDLSELADIAIYSVDKEGAGVVPEQIVALNKLFKSVDGFIISFAEHNGSFAAGYKNIIDWISRQEGKVFNEKPVFLMATSPGGRGGATVLGAALNYYPYLGAKITGSVSVPSFGENYKDNRIVNEEILSNIKCEITKFESEL